MTFVIVMGFHQIIVVMNDVKRHTYIHTVNLMKGSSRLQYVLARLKVLSVYTYCGLIVIRKTRKHSTITRYFLVSLSENFIYLQYDIICIYICALLAGVIIFIKIKFLHGFIPKL